MTIVSLMTVLATKGEPVKAESVAGVSCEVVEFFDPEAFAEEISSDTEFLTMDVPLETWQQMGEPTEITVSLIPGDITGDHFV